MEGEEDFLALPPEAEGLPGWEVETLGADDRPVAESDLPDEQNQVVDPTLEKYRNVLAGLSKLQLREMIEKNNPGISRKDIQRMVVRMADKEQSEAEERVGVKFGKLPNGLLMKNPGDFRKDEKVQKKNEKLAFGSPGLYERGQRLPYNIRGWNVARVNLYDV